MSLFNKQATPIFLKEDSQTTRQIAELTALMEQAQGRQKDDIKRELTQAQYGDAGEKHIAFELKNAGIPMYIIRDLHLQFGDLTAQIDFAVVTRKLIFFLECKNLYGNIDIDSQGNFSRNYQWNGKWVKEGIYSPVTQNQRHLDVLKQIGRGNKSNVLTRVLYESGFDSAYKGLVVLANPKTLLRANEAPKAIRDQVIRADQLIECIKAAVKNSKELQLNDKELKDRAEGLLSLHKPIGTDYTSRFRAQPSSPPAHQPQAKISEVGEPYAVTTASPTAQAAGAGAHSPDDAALIARLKAFRLATSRKENIKAYVVFNDRQLSDLIARKPKTLAELQRISGFGPVKAQNYGPGILAILNAPTAPAVADQKPALTAAVRPPVQSTPAVAVPKPAVTVAASSSEQLPPAAAVKKPSWSFAELIGEHINHRTYGAGIIKSVTKNEITIQFKGMAMNFDFPKVFDTTMWLLKPALQLKVEALIEA
jgi:hypothetical protein